MSNRIGKRGESIFWTIITRKGPTGRFLFDPTFLGDKFPTVDFYVSLLDYPKKNFFFASVKATTQGLRAVYFSRLNDLIIKESNGSDELFDYWIDIRDDHGPTGRLFAVEVKAYNRMTKKEKLAKWIEKAYRNLTFPALLVLFDNNNDHGYYIWIKKPEQNGELRFELAKGEFADLNNDSLNHIVTEIKNWYSNKQVA